MHSARDGSGEQTRDLLYVEDCADFIVSCALAESAEGQIVTGAGADVAIKDLAELCASATNRVEHVAHEHPQAEIMKLLCDSSKATRLLGWTPKVDLAEGLRRTRQWLEANRWAW